jgi:hypothetical protein
MTVDYYEESYPPSVLGYASGATAGIPGSWSPAGAIAPKSPAELSQGYPLAVTANPATPWTTGQYVQTATAGIPGRATWTGTNWVSGAAPLKTDTTEPERFEAIPVTNTPEESEPNPDIEPDTVPEPVEPPEDNPPGRNPR